MAIYCNLFNSLDRFLQIVIYQTDVEGAITLQPSEMLDSL